MGFDDALFANAEAFAMQAFAYPQGVDLVGAAVQLLGGDYLFNNLVFGGAGGGYVAFDGKC